VPSKRIQKFQRISEWANQGDKKLGIKSQVPKKWERNTRNKTKVAILPKKLTCETEKKGRKVSERGGHEEYGKIELLLHLPFTCILRERESTTTTTNALFREDLGRSSFSLLRSSLSQCSSLFCAFLPYNTLHFLDCLSLLHCLSAPWIIFRFRSPL